jgi:hypothetical protein
MGLIKVRPRRPFGSTMRRLLIDDFLLILNNLLMIREVNKVANLILDALCTIELAADFHKPMQLNYRRFILLCRTETKMPKFKTPIKAAK